MITDVEVAAPAAVARADAETGPWEADVRCRGQAATTVDHGNVIGHDDWQKNDRDTDRLLVLRHTDSSVVEDSCQRRSGTDSRGGARLLPRQIRPCGAC